MITTNTPYAAKNPSVCSVRPNSRAMTTPITAAKPLTTSSEVAVSAALARDPRPDDSVRLATDAEAYGPCRTTPSGQAARSTISRQEFGGVYDGRTVLVTGADGFMGSHLTDALVELGADRARVRARDLERRAQQHRAPAQTA